MPTAICDETDVVQPIQCSPSFLNLLGRVSERGMLDDPVYFGAYLGATVGSTRKESTRRKAISTSDNLSIEMMNSLVLSGGVLLFLRLR